MKYDSFAVIERVAKVKDMSGHRRADLTPASAARSAASAAFRSGRRAAALSASANDTDLADAS
jgi:hypothetical protein